MLPVAFASSTWTAMLRRIARTAVATLALVAGLQGLAAPSADATATTRPAVAVATVDIGSASPTTIGGTHAEPARAVLTVGTAVAAPTTALAAQPVTGGPAVADPTGDTHVASVPAAERAVTDPGRAAIARRGPPRA
ncbi:hypothetical protein [Micromonospora robiginosa]|uniref:Uncharacterized protein n=1 Tax=Micromonospora robiginosa TaxID=2749844 RepID=A0A7L6BBN5_9ACTN|nr:hypothetical protein [Micromonospora ferruginea]QLQ39040.1 hypothetical protein H1D33_09530 [Micromonospora ferruginea]